MTQRHYYTDAYTTTFTASVVERTTLNEAPALVLDQTYFYPTSGGQPHDTGWLDDVPVVDVAIREADGAVLHVLARELDADQVTGRIDWARRFDHMRHHTGQHVLSRAFIEVAGADTVGFHLSPDSVTIDLNVPNLDADTIARAEDLANATVAENRPVRAWFPAEDELAGLDLRKMPDVDGRFRVVQIADFDDNACGGTHVAATGEIGLIKVLRVERRGETVRIEFCCGARAFDDYRAKHDVLSHLAAEMTTAYTELPAALEKLRAENKVLRREASALQARVLAAEAEQLWQAAPDAGGYRRVVAAFDDRSAGEVRQLVQHLIAHPATIALCGAAGDKAQLICARSDDLPHDMVPVLLAGLAVWGLERGGGRPSFAQGGGATAARADVEAALAAAAQRIDAT